MKFKDIFNKLIKKSSESVNKVESDDSYCYSKLIWNTNNNIIILISFTQDYFEQIIDIQDAINYNQKGLCSKIVYSSYDEKTDKQDEDGNDIWVIHKKHYLLIGGSPSAWEELYMNIHDLGNEVLNKISNEIVNNCDPAYFNRLIEDGILFGFSEEHTGDIPVETENKRFYTNPTILLNELPNGFTGRDLLKFIKIETCTYDINTITNAFEEIEDIYSLYSNERFKNHELYPLYDALIKDPTVEKLKMLTEPLYKQPDDDSIPGDVSDESLDELFREHYERFSAIADDSIQYEDIDEEIADDEESENIREEDKF